MAERMSIFLFESAFVLSSEVGTSPKYITKN